MITEDGAVKESQISVNWLLNQVLGAGKTNYQITKISDDQLNLFLKFLVDNPFPMPDGESVLQWLRDRIQLRYDQIQNKMSIEWEKTRQRYRYLLHQLALLAVTTPQKEKIIIENKQELTISFPESL